MKNAILIFFLGIISCFIGISFLVSETVNHVHTGYWAYQTIEYLRYLGIVR